MKRALLLAAAVATLASPATHALAWGSLVPGFNTHGCIDEAAYKALAADPAFKGAAFPKIEEVLSDEGVNSDAVGPGPDNEGSTDYSEHYYNPRIGQAGAGKGGSGKAPYSAGDWFVKLASRTNQPQGAAWAAHFLADVSVVYHVNGEPGSMIEQAYKDQPDRKSLMLGPEVTGDRALLSRPLISVLPTHGMDFKREADRYLATAKAAQAKTGKAYFDWFDPWYFNGVTDSAVTSSHLTYEAEAQIMDGCPKPPTAYSALWPGNADPQFPHPILAQRDTVVAFVKANARSTVVNATEFFNDPSEALNQAATSVYTLWRASISGLKIGLTTSIDPGSLSGDNPSPVFKVTGKLANFADETPTDVQVQLSVLKGPCKTLPAGGTDVQPVAGVTTGVHPAGQWRVEMAKGDASCQIEADVIGKFAKTPDLQYAWTRANLKLGAESAYQGPITFKHGEFKGMSMHFQVRPGALDMPATLSLKLNNGQVTGQLRAKIICGPEIPSDSAERSYCVPFDGQIKGTVDAKGVLTGSYKGVYHTTMQGFNGDVTQVGGLTGKLTAKGAEGDLTVWFLDSRSNEKKWSLTGIWSVSTAGR